MAKRTLTTAAQAAQMIKRALKAQGLDVKVTSQNYSMGHSVDVRVFHDNPEILKLVNQYCEAFRSGHFDGMTDSYVRSNRREDLPQVDYVTVTRG